MAIVELRDGNCLFFDGNLTIYRVGDLKKKLIEILAPEKERTGDWTFDFSKTEVIDAAAFQLVISLKTSLELQKATVKVRNICKEFEQSVELFGFDRNLNAKAG